MKENSQVCQNFAISAFTGLSHIGFASFAPFRPPKYEYVIDLLESLRPLPASCALFFESVVGDAVTDVDVGRLTARSLDSS